MTTPESQQVQSDRKSSFLDNIGERVEFEEQRKESQQRRRAQGRREAVRAGRGGKTAAKNKKTSTKRTGQVNFWELCIIPQSM